MIKRSQIIGKRENYQVDISSDIVVVGGGLSGTTAAITAAREGSKVVLIQDRPVLGGNSSSEVRLWVLGATSHMGNNNRWAREGGVIDEILVENIYRNREGNGLIFDTILLEKVIDEPNITLLLNSAVYDIDKSSDSCIDGVTAFCSQSSTKYHIKAPMFIDASGDGVVAFMAGAPFRMGAESKEEFGEQFAPDEEYGEMLGHTIYFYSKDSGAPVKYVAPSFALKDIKEIPRYKNIKSGMDGCNFWWFEYGGREEDTVKTTEQIKWELWKVVYGAWDYIKNSGDFPDADNMTLEWVGMIPGKRESRRFEGEYMIKQQDIIEQNQFDDAVAFGGWAIDLHPSDGVYSSLPSCTQWHSKGVYQIPYRSLISSSIDNLLLAGRIMSASHVAFGSTRVMATSAHCGQAIGIAANICVDNNLTTKEIISEGRIKQVQNRLNIMGQSIPNIKINYDMLQVAKPEVTASSVYNFNGFTFDGEWISLSEGVAQLLPLKSENRYGFKILVNVLKPKTKLIAELCISSKLGNYTPDVVIESLNVKLDAGEQNVLLQFTEELESDQYAFIILRSNSNIEVMSSNERLSGILSLFQKRNEAVSNIGVQSPPDGIGVDSFEFWTPKRRPDGKNLAFETTESIQIYSKNNIVNGYVRPYIESNAWTADLNDKAPELTLNWKTPQTIDEIRIFFDSDYDHPMESVQFGHPEDIMPFCVKNFSIYDQNNNKIASRENNYQTISQIKLDGTIETSKLTFRFEAPSDQMPVTIFEIVCLNNSN